MNESRAFLISRAKSTMNYTVIESNFNIDPKSGLRSDKTIILNGYKSSRLYPEPLRLVEYYDEEKDILLSFLSNNDMLTTLDIVKLYQKRWQIEIFSSGSIGPPTRQNLTIKTLWGHSENTVNIHMGCHKHLFDSSLSQTYFEKQPLHI
jgi:hypothetical protein